MAETKKAKRVYTYIRVSTEMQIEGYSLDSQKDRLEKEAKAKGWKIVDRFADEGKSGHSIAGRPQFKEMLERIRNGNPDKVDYVLVYKLSRFGRNAADALSSLKIMQKRGVELYCAEEGIDSAGASGYLMITIMAAVAEIERENILVQTMAGRHQKAREGKWNGGQAPYGYKINKDTSVLEIDEEEAKIVRLIFEQFANEPMGVNGVARWLEANGYRKKLRGNGKYTLFSAHTLKTILDNPVYTGKIAYGRRKIERVLSDDEETEITRRLNNDEYGLYEGMHEAIISDELWNKVRVKRKDTSVKHEKTHSLEHEHLLSGLLKCPMCGAPMYGTVNRKKKKDGTYYPDAFYYVCKHRKLIDGQKCDYRRQPPQDPINAEVIAMVKHAILSPVFIANTMQELTKETDTKELQDRLTALKNTRTKKMRTVNILTGQMNDLDIVDDAAYELAYTDLLARQKTLYEEVAEIDRQIQDVQIAIQKEADAKVSLTSAVEMLVDLGQNFNSDKYTDQEKKGMLSEVIERVDLFPERLPNGRYVKGITFKFPIILDGKPTRQWWYKQDTDETVVLMSRTK